ncbi:tetratricopeptide repeat-containing sulfotransferase family protein [Hyphococcus sp.]|uniref:tetratricopeptide repeat-containing sulfotransferase family protein n=1 Tax=Hyphococcus sp. TaxID=2038636 RepID=UPI0020888DF0|nr:MAG: hypothetical protein DHS20C04_06410 [Marinicaulis sp.]
MQGDIFAQASVARLNGDNQTAIKLCRDILADAPDRLDAISLLGVNLAETGDLDGARPLITRALNAEPQNWRFLLNNSVLLECEGKLAAARAEAKKAADVSPERFEAWGRLGDLDGKLEDYSGAVEALEKALAAFPGHPALALRLAGAAYELGDYARANAALDTFEKAAPGHPQALHLRMHIARKKNNWDELITAASASLAASPDEEAPRVALAFAYAQQGHSARAAEVYRPLAEKQPPQATHLATLAKYLLGARSLEAGAALYRQALELEPNNSAAGAGYARHLNFTGDFENAALYARQAIASDPNNAEAFAELALAVNSKLTDKEIAQLEQIGNNNLAGVKHQAIALFASGDAHHQRKDRKKAFAAWMRANELKRSLGDSDASAKYDPESNENYINRIIESFPADFAGSEEERQQRPAPIFIVGMPRSGTTLLDSAISAHKNVASAGELPYMTFALNEYLSLKSPSDWTTGALPPELTKVFREKYKAQYKDFSVAEAPFITDKQPSNFYSVGLIRKVFPEAKIIHIRRNPVEVCFSMFRRNFSTSWQASTSLENLADYYSQYVRITDYWRSILGDNFGFIQYEDLVQDFETNLRRLIDFCELEWDQNCLEYYKQDRTVITFSAAQVRKPPSPEHLNSTAPYEEQLQPLYAALRAKNIDLETGARL